MAKARRQRAVFCGIVEIDGAIQMHSSFCNLTYMQKGHAHKAVADHFRSTVVFLFRQCQELSGKFTSYIATKCTTFPIQNV